VQATAEGKVVEGAAQAVKSSKFVAVARDSVAAGDGAEQAAAAGKPHEDAATAGDGARCLR
jgi:hypothetical protein